ncbi:hypothetical protein DERP_008636 [Dermatophagoides pteronyssinus]|uniref:Uncharacterized protein n=1 Tax=Dermatophagoides pteronyssinus TaxID=6956 RepID=A0ABQ8IXH2_DERPT|nr:hypothetical protein DERP_008636 [Dermatophagoides pteronyssinus]
MTSGQICVDKLIENIETQPKSTLNIFTQQRQNYRPWNKDNIKFVNNRMITGQQQLNETLNKDSFGFQQQQKDIHHHSNLPILFKSSSSSSSTLLNKQISV